jgi:CheY-like chemotaxis protein
MSEDVPEGVREDLEIVHSEANRAAKIVHNLLSFARRPDPVKMYMDVTSVLDRALEMKTYDYQVGNVEVSRDFSADLPRTMVDEQELTQVVLNILNTAEQAMRSLRGGGRLTVRTTSSKERIKVSIGDDGPGIPAEHLARIFEPFFTTKAAGKGTGLGLSISYGIVQQHGGDIWAESTPGEGTTFHIELPITGGEAVGSPPPAGPPQPFARTKNVLLVDDEPNIRECLFRSLELKGFTVDLAGDGEEALRRLQGRVYDCILLDLKMPGMSGQHLYQTIEARDRELAGRVIFITGDTVNSDTRDFIAAAGNIALSKPIDLEELTRRVWSTS